MKKTIEPVEQHRIRPERWQALATEPEFRALLAARRRFIVPATVFFIAYYLALPICVGLAPQVMSRPLLGPLTIAYCFALSEFVVAFILVGLFLWLSRRFDLAAARIRRHESHENKP